MPVSSTEKSPIDREVYEGLQVDTRNNSVNTQSSRGRQGLHDQDDSDHEDNNLSEKQAVVQQQPQDYTGSTNPASSAGRELVGRETSIVVLPDECAESIPTPKVRRIYGVRRRNFWVIFGIFLTTIIAAAVICGATGGTRHSSSISDNGKLHPEDVLIGSPLTVLSNYTDGQKLTMYFQSADGAIKESITYNNGVAWQPARPIFTDAIKNTGLASFSYWDAGQQFSIFYVNSDRCISEKRRSSTTGNWDTFGQAPLKICSINNSPYKTAGEPGNGWDAYRMTAVYSEIFESGAGRRLFYHNSDSSSGDSIIQELIGYKNGSWSPGASFDVYPNSHLSATIDESTKILQLFYSTGGRALQYSWLDITKKDAKYEKGPSLEDYLIFSSADIAAISDNGTTYVYHYSAPVLPNHKTSTPNKGISIQDNSTGAQGIQELRISGPPGAEIFSFNGPIPSSPKLESPYQPLTASISRLKNKMGTQIRLFWADKMMGSTDFAFAVSNNKSGYSQLSEASRSVKNSSSWLTKPEAIPLI